MDEGEEVGGSSVVAGCDATEVLELVDAALDAIPQIVKGEVVGDEALAGGVAGNDRRPRPPTTCVVMSC